MLSRRTDQVVALLPFAFLACSALLAYDNGRRVHFLQVSVLKRAIGCRELLKGQGCRTTLRVDDTRVVLRDEEKWGFQLIVVGGALGV